MKKILSLFGFFVSLFVSAQDYQFIDQVKSIPNQEKAISLATEIASNSSTKLRLYKSKEFPKLNVFKVVFVPVKVTDQDIENYNVSEVDRLNYVTIIFAIGKESKSYWLTEMEASEKDMLPIWNRYFKRKDSTKEFDNTHLKDAERKLDFYIQKRDPVWILINQS